MNVLIFLRPDRGAFHSKNAGANTRKAAGGGGYGVARASMSGARTLRSEGRGGGGLPVKR